MREYIERIFAEFRDDALGENFSNTFYKPRRQIALYADKRLRRDADDFIGLELAAVNLIGDPASFSRNFLAFPCRLRLADNSNLPRTGKFKLRGGLNVKNSIPVLFIAIDDAFNYAAYRFEFLGLPSLCALGSHFTSSSINSSIGEATERTSNLN